MSEHLNMTPIVVDPNDFNKESAYALAVTYVSDLLTKNNVELPKKIMTADPKKGTHSNSWKDNDR